MYRHLVDGNRKRITSQCGMKESEVEDGEMEESEVEKSETGKRETECSI